MVSVRSYKGSFIPERHGLHGRRPVFPPPQPSNTDGTGTFVIKGKGITAPTVNLLTLFPERNSDYEIRGIEIQGIDFSIHPHQLYDAPRISFRY